MGISLSSGDLGMPEQLADHREIVTVVDGGARKVVPKIVHPDIGDLGLDADPIPEPLEGAQGFPSLSARDRVGTVLDLFES